MHLQNPLTIAKQKYSDKDTWSEEEKFSRLDEILDMFRDEPGNLISCLYAAQSIFGYLPNNVIKHVAQYLHHPVVTVLGVVTFYSFFTRFPKGKYSIKVCLGTACYVRGGKHLLEQVVKELKIKVGETTPDGLFSLEIVRCIGACALAPVMLVNNDTHKRMKINKVSEILSLYTKEAKGVQNDKK
ncbi:MAG: NAD(P)H-dependent oxidoreductase subunit E [Spirochaetes bacterium]|nr:NAD(P)H-dependent oxidoreductase subunit E [Spirochaetota bacterium]MBN2771963.1 NAD(P)H-dependent oxidoreductase subunit E [Spirochaetota bacterium]